ncbi:MAG: hypothetical protein RIS33_261, partial [Actinomycetota bacterium]
MVHLPDPFVVHEPPPAAETLAPLKAPPPLTFA